MNHWCHMYVLYIHVYVQYAHVYVCFITILHSTIVLTLMDPTERLTLVGGWRVAIVLLSPESTSASTFSGVLGSWNRNIMLHYYTYMYMYMYIHVVVYKEGILHGVYTFCGIFTPWSSSLLIKLGSICAILLWSSNSYSHYCSLAKSQSLMYIHLHVHVHNVEIIHIHVHTSVYIHNVHIHISPAVSGRD